MPIIQSAKKRVRTSAREYEENRLHRARARTTVKRIHDLVAAGKANEALAALPDAQAYLDKAAKTRAIHPNAAARQKARLAQLLKRAGSQDKTPARVKVTAAPAVKKPAAKPAAKAAPKPASSKAERKPADPK